MTRADDRWIRTALCLVLLIALCSMAGCSRPFYREQADADTYSAIRQKANDPRWPLRRYRVDPDPRSRYYNPYSPDFPPMPPDDPTSHQLMHYVDGKEGFPCWHQNGDTPFVANPNWQAYLPYDKAGAVVLDRQAAVQLALIHSRDYQQELEDLYLSALDVTAERFRFDAQFFGTNATTFQADGRVRGGGQSSSILSTDTDLSMRKLYAAGGELVVGFANSFVWQFAGPDTETSRSLLDFSIFQPLLRFAGRPRMLERLTFAERTLLGNVRQMERYRRGFYVEVVAGRDAGQGPSRAGGFFGGAGLEGFTGVGGGGFGRVGGFGGGAGGGGGFAGGAGAAEAGGFIGLLQDQLQINNQEANVVALRDSLAQLQAWYDTGRIDRLQVDQARQALYNAQSLLLNAKAQFEAAKDAFKLTLGLPPTLNLGIHDPMLDQFLLIDPNLTEIQVAINDLLDRVRTPGEENPLADRAALDAGVGEGLRRIDGHVEVVRGDLERLRQTVPERRVSLERLIRRPDFAEGRLDPSAYLPADLDQRVAAVHRDFQELVRRLQATEQQLRQTVAAGAPADLETLRQRLVDVLTDVSGELLELSLVQARARLDAITLVPVELDSYSALEIARMNRRDWMNARASLVDSWRLIEFNANPLKSGLDLVISGDLGTTDDDPFRFRDVNGRLRVGLQFDAPLTRLFERNIYRESLLDYQQARRRYLLTIDSIAATLRNTLRTIELNQLNFELRRAAVFVAITQVDLARLRLVQPPRPGVEEQFGSTTARDLVDALRDLLNVQNDFLSVWVNYELQRMFLDFDLGTMQLDDQGMWIDPGAITVDWQPLPEAEPVDPAGEIPPPEPMPERNAMPIVPDGSSDALRLPSEVRAPAVRFAPPEGGVRLTGSITDSPHLEGTRSADR